MAAATLDRVVIWISAFIPMSVVAALGSCFAGDARGFSSDYDEPRYRLRSEISISGFSRGTPEWTEFHQVGESRQLDCVNGEVLRTGYATTDAMSFHDFHVGNTYPDPEGGVVELPNDESAGFLYDGAGSNPLAGLVSPDVDATFFAWIDPVGRVVSLRGAVNDFPDYEAYVRVDDGPPIVLFQHAHEQEPVGGLPGGADQPVAAAVQV